MSAIKIILEGTPKTCMVGIRPCTVTPIIGVNTNKDVPERFVGAYYSINKHIVIYSATGTENALTYWRVWKMLGMLWEIDPDTAGDCFLACSDLSFEDPAFDCVRSKGKDWVRHFVEQHTKILALTAPKEELEKISHGFLKNNMPITDIVKEKGLFHFTEISGLENNSNGNSLAIA